MISVRPPFLQARPIPRNPPTPNRARTPDAPRPLCKPLEADPGPEANRERALGLLAYGLHHPGILLILLLGCLLGRTQVNAQSAGGIDLWPRDTTVDVASSRQFGAYVPLSPNTVTWLVNDIPGGNGTVGTISPGGLYQAPSVAPTPSTVTIRAQSTAYSQAWAATSLKVTRKYPWLWSVSKVGGGTLQVGNFEVSLNGSNFAPDSVVTANGTDLPTTYFSPTKLTAVGAAAAPGTIQIAVRQPAPGAVTGNSVSVTISGAPVTVNLTPTSLSLPLGASQGFTATVAGSTNLAVTWTVNGVTGGNSTLGLISPAGHYTAPAALPVANPVSLRATSVANPLVFAQATVTLIAPPPPISVAVVPTTATVPLGGTQALTATVTGSPNTAVIWSVNGISGGNPTVGTVSSSGLYTAPISLPAGSNVTVTATSVANPSGTASAILTLIAPPPPVLISLSAARFLEQASFGPTPTSLAQVQQQGIPAWLQAQFALSATAFPVPAGNSVQDLQRWMLYNYTTAPDQLRQRVIYALSQIVVTSASKLVYADEMLPWLNALRQHAFGNYRDLLRDVTKTSSMGKYLDLANSLKPGLGGGANENYPRELLQLFTIGLWQLDLDGSQLLDSQTNALPAYTQADVAELSRALTGWTYATAPGATPHDVNNEYHGAPMEARPNNHDFGSKTLLGVSIPAGQTVEQDLESVLEILMNHPNTAPFIATRLIRSLVLSNPSGEYIERVSTVFQQTDGDLPAVITAILTDPEARNDTPTVHSGRLKEPILQVAGFLRALNGQFNSTQQLTYLFSYFAQSPLNPPSVFSWFSPLYRVPKSSLFGPEFQIYTPTEATLRGNFFHHLLGNSGGDFTLDLTPFQPYGSNLPALVEEVNQRLLYGRMSAEMKTVLINAAAPGYDAKTRIETVLYLTALSGQYAVQY